MSAEKKKQSITLTYTLKVSIDCTYHYDYMKTQESYPIKSTFQKVCNNSYLTEVEHTFKLSSAEIGTFRLI